ncbi:unnamed protein product [Discula destructiva]
MQSLTFLIFAPAFSCATKLLLPLYQYPEGTTWDPVYSAIEANKDVVFQIIINVDTGPGGSSGPDSNFVTGMSKLNSYSNVETLGYVHCQYGEGSQEDIQQNVTNWAAWNSYSGANASIGGIFFDETPNTEGGDNDVSFMQAAVGAASSAFGAHPFTSMFNPGSSVEHDEFWTLADYNVIFEADASTYSASVLTTNIPSGKAGQSSILIYDFASVGSESTATEWLQGMDAAGVGSAHILDFDYIQATTADTPASIGSVAVALAVVPAGTGTEATSGDIASSSSTTVSDAVDTQSETDSDPASSSPTPSEAAISSSSKPAETPVTPSTTKPTHSAGGHHRHHHWERANGARA